MNFSTTFIIYWDALVFSLWCEWLSFIIFNLWKPTFSSQMAGSMTWKRTNRWVVRTPSFVQRCVSSFLPTCDYWNTHLYTICKQNIISAVQLITCDCHAHLIIVLVVFGYFNKKNLTYIVPLRGFVATFFTVVLNNDVKVCLVSRLLVVK